MCVSSASMGPCGGCGVTRIPTETRVETRLDPLLRTSTMRRHGVPHAQVVLHAKLGVNAIVFGRRSCGLVHREYG